jgi:DNA-binding response OmpR family regulator
MAEPLSPEAPTSPPATVLLVEDDLVLAATLVKYLMAHDHDVLSAPSAEAASAALRAGLRPSVVLLDLNLPGESGWAFLRSGILAQAGQPPVFIMSAIHLTPGRLREFGCAGYLPKPFAVSTLLEVVEGHRGARTEAASRSAGAADTPVGREPESGAATHRREESEFELEDLNSVSPPS